MFLCRTKKINRNNLLRLYLQREMNILKNGLKNNIALSKWTKWSLILINFPEYIKFSFRIQMKRKICGTVLQTIDLNKISWNVAVKLYLYSNFSKVQLWRYFLPVSFGIRLCLTRDKRQIILLLSLTRPAHHRHLVFGSL